MPDKPMTKKELENYSTVLTMAGPARVMQIYRTIHAECRMEGDEPPPAAAVQKLVAAWKMMRKQTTRRQG